MIDESVLPVLKSNAKLLIIQWKLKSSWIHFHKFGTRITHFEKTIKKVMMLQTAFISDKYCSVLFRDWYFKGREKYCLRYWVYLAYKNRNKIKLFSWIHHFKHLKQKLSARTINSLLIARAENFCFNWTNAKPWPRTRKCRVWTEHIWHDFEPKYLMIRLNMVSVPVVIPV